MRSVASTSICARAWNHDVQQSVINVLKGSMLTQRRIWCSLLRVPCQFGEQSDATGTTAEFGQYSWSSPVRGAFRPSLHKSGPQWACAAHTHHSSVVTKGALENAACLICNDLSLPFGTFHCSRPLEKPLQQGVCERQQRSSTDRITSSVLRTPLASSRDAATWMLTYISMRCWRPWQTHITVTLCHTMDRLQPACSWHQSAIWPSLAQSSNAGPHRRLGTWCRCTWSCDAMRHITEVVAFLFCKPDSWVTPLLSQLRHRPHRFP